jgi:hypothetical protein
MGFLGMVPSTKNQFYPIRPAPTLSRKLGFQGLGKVMAKPTHPVASSATIVAKQATSGKSLTVAQFQELQRQVQLLDNVPGWERDRAQDRLFSGL